MEPNPDLLGQYTAYMEDVGNIGDRHQTARRFYLSVISALLVFLSMAGGKGPFNDVKLRVQIVVGFAGLAICLLWFCHMRSFGALYKAKFDILKKMEKSLPYQIFAEEWECLEKAGGYALLTSVDALMPVVFALICLAILALK
jgi:hypothetical protein